ncbi:protein ALTERED XYLOGLUCAN 4-like [Vigna unguiculata]|uniref:protein ALTERED XYLOGLUCAN 4-like n=1 Tax=Vigna unguiculata TaxID=3917 RepID=UPI001016EE71|nr:protein ALTERED XYLOGLUCAN 4-like [Vigna unguiculata]
MAFIGDSVSRNHVESLLCLLSQSEVPKDMYKDSEDRFRKWYFPIHNFTLMMLWSRFLVEGEERMANGTGTSVFDMQLDKVDSDWAKELPNLDYAVISDGHWFFRGMRLHEAGKQVGCVYCNEPNVTAYNVDFPLRKALRTAFRHISGCRECRRRGMVTVMRSFAAAHFENGFWNTGGYCNRTGPRSESEVDFGAFDWQLRNVQMEEFERARSEGGGRFEVVDVARAMLMRPDGHPGEHWGNKWMKGYNDCTHWCMPGPVDMWSELLLAVIKKVSASHHLHQI